MIRRVWMIPALSVFSLAAGAAELPFKPVPACGQELQVQREAASLHLQADRLQAQGDLNGAREKWQASLEAYRQIGFLASQAEVLLRLGASYQVEGSLDPQKMSLSRNYNMQGYLAGAEFLDSLASREVPKDPESVKEADSLFKQASDFSQMGDCQKAVPLFVEAGEQYAQAGFVAGELHTFVGRLRCQVKNGDPIGDMKILGEFLSAGPKFKFRAGTFVRYLMAVGNDVRENREEAEKLYRTALREFEEAKDLVNASRVALDLGSLLVCTGNLAEAETLFKQASERFAALSDAGSQCNEAAALQNLGGVQLASGHAEAAIPTLQRVSELWQSLAETARAAETLNALSGALRSQGNVTAAEAALALAKALEKKTEPKPASPNVPQPGTKVDEPSPDMPSAQPPLTQSSSPSASLEGVLFAPGPRALAQRKGTLLLGEGDRLLQTGHLRGAREKWLESAVAFGRVPDYMGSAQAYKRLSDSYTPEIYSDPQKQLLSAKYLSLAVMAAAKDRQESLKGRTSPLDATHLEKAWTLLEEAEKWIESGDCAKAQPKLTEAGSLYRIVGLTVGEVSVLAFEGRCAAMSGDFYKATMTSVKAVEILSALPATAPTRELAWRAEGLFDQGRRDEALALFQEALERYEQAKDEKGVFDALLGLGIVQASKDDFAGAEESFFRALKSLPTLGVSDQDRRFQEASARQNLGSVYTFAGRGDKAVTELRAAVALWRELGELVREVVTLSVFGIALQESGDVPAALAALDEADSLQGRLPSNPEIEGDLLNNRAKVYYSQGRYQEALDLFRRALVLYQKLPDSRKEAQALTNLGTAESDLGHFNEALAAHEQAKDVANRLGLATLSAKIELNTVKLLIESGRSQEGIQICLGLLAKGIKEPQLLAMVHTNLGTAYLQLGAFDKAKIHLQQAVESFQSLGNREFEATARVDNGQLLLRLGDTAKAEAENQKALDIWRDLGNEVMVNRVLGNLGWMAALREVSEADVQGFQRGLERSRTVGQTADAVRFSLLLGMIALQRGDFAGAIEHASEALVEADRIGDSVGQYVGRTMLMEAHYYQGDFPAALKDLDAAVTGLDRWQSSLTLSEFKSSFLAQPVFFETYALGVLLNAETGKPEEAFQYAEQARARAFQDQIGNQRIEVRRGTDPELVRQEGELRAQLAHLGEAIQQEKTSTPASAPKSERQTSLEKAQAEAQSEYSTLLSRLKLANLEYAALVSVNTLSLREIQQQVLDAQTTLIEYFVPDPPRRGSSAKIFAWVIDRDHFTMIRLPISSSDLENQVKQLRFHIQDKDSVEPPAAELYRALFAPLAPHVRHRNLIIIPHGVLHFLPFAALWDEANRRYLGDAYTLSYAPSATVLKFARAKTAQAVGPVLVAGNPDGSLPHASSEARAVAKLYGGEPLLGRAATKSAVVARAGQAGILHLAAHAELNEANPLFTRIKLAPDGGDLEMHEVFGLDLSRTGLVVLSACSTQMGKLSAGDELEGLTRAFLYAGTPAVVASLWDVADEPSTSFFMQRFYTHLRQRTGRAESLRLAQRETRRRFPRPYQWAAFVLTGDGR